MKTQQNVLLTALDERWKKFRIEIKTCKSDFSAEAVHDLRVATRRLLAVMDILRILDPHPRVQKVRRVLKDQLDSLDELRDTQVMLVDVSETLAELPDLKMLEKRLLTREKRLLRQARKEIKDLSVLELKRRIEKSRIQLEENAHQKDWTARLLSVVDQAYARAIQASDQIEALQPATIHQFRVIFKKLRYMIEIASLILAGYPDVYFKQMHEYQSRMGDVQDADVLWGAFTEFEEQSDDKIALASARKWFKAHRLELITKFMNGREAIHKFWRPSPNENFPSEQVNESVHHPSRNRPGTNTAHGGQPAPADGKGQKENAENRAGLENIGDRDQFYSDQPISESHGNSHDSAKNL